MNEYSFLCRYISEHTGWETLLISKYGLKIRREGPYAIFNYGYESNFSDPLVQEARGIILDTERLDVVCWPFRKFGNYGEEYADSIDWKTACVQEKVDGSIVKLWFSTLQDRWTFSTNSTIDAANAPIEESSFGHTFLDAILSAENYNDIHMDELDKDNTYIFELVSPETRVIVSYPRTMLYHTGTRSNRTGEEFNKNIGIIQPVRYPLSNLTECIEAAKKLNNGKAGVEHEGFVVVDANWNRVKIKSPDYLVRHQIANIYLSKENALELLLNEKKNILLCLCLNLIGLVVILAIHYYKLKTTGAGLGFHMRWKYYTTCFLFIPITVAGTLINRALYRETHNVFVGPIVFGTVATIISTAVMMMPDYLY